MQRPLLVLVAFSVAVVTLVVQGGTLAWAVGRLGVEADRTEIWREQIGSLRTLLTDVAASRCDDVEASGLDGQPVEPLVVAVSRDRSEPERFVQWAGPEGPERERRLADLTALRRAILADQREALLDARASGRYDSEVLGAVLRRVDQEEIALLALA